MATMGRTFWSFASIAPPRPHTRLSVCTPRVPITCLYRYISRRRSLDARHVGADLSKDVPRAIVQILMRSSSPLQL